MRGDSAWGQGSSLFACADEEGLKKLVREQQEQIAKLEGIVLHTNLHAKATYLHLEDGSLGFEQSIFTTTSTS